MGKVIFAAAAMLALSLAQGVFAEPPEKEREKEFVTLQQKLLGMWEGQGGCNGRLTIREDGRFDLTGYGPGNSSRTGTWKVRWDALPPTLVFTYKNSGKPDEASKIMEVKLIKLDDKNLTIEYANKNSLSGKYNRVQK